MRQAVMQTPVFDAILLSNFLKYCRVAKDLKSAKRRLRAAATFGFTVINFTAGVLAAGVLTAGVLALGATTAGAQDTAAQEAAHRGAALARLPADAAKRVFGLQTTPAPGPAQAIGTYAKGCLAGGVELPADGPNWQVMRPSRDRAWGAPALIAFIERLAAAAAREAQWPGLLIGDIAQPRGGPMLTGHASHQMGIEA